MASITGNAASNAQKRLDALKREWEEQGGVGAFVPKTGSKEDFDKLVAAVEAAKVRNENIAALRERISGLGKSVVALAKTLGVIV
jgi:hypothetical protein